jgi:hypothetical protein
MKGFYKLQAEKFSAIVASNPSHDRRDTVLRIDARAESTCSLYDLLAV